MAVAGGFLMDRFLSMLERAIKPQLFLLAVSFVFFLDWTMLHLSGVGIKAAIEGVGAFSLSLALQVALIYVMFSGLTSFVIPLLLSPIFVIYIAITSKWDDIKHYVAERFFEVTGEGPYHRDQEGYVTAYRLQEEAFREENKFLMERYLEHKETVEMDKSQRKEMQVASLYAFVFVLLNFMFSGEQSKNTISSWISDYFDSNTPIWSALAIFGFIVLYHVKIDLMRDADVYYPPLYDKLKKEEEARLAAQCELERKMRYKRDNN